MNTPIDFNNNNQSAAVYPGGASPVVNGNMNLLGMQVKVSDIIGDKIVDQFIASLSADQMNSINKALFDEVFEEVTNKEWDAETKEYKKVMSTQFKKLLHTYTTYGIGTRTEETPVYARAKATIKDRYTDMIEKAVVKYIESDEYKAKAEQIAKDIVDYATEGYKKDIVDGIRRRLVLPTLNPEQDRINIEEVATKVMEDKFYPTDHAYPREIVTENVRI